MLLTAQVVDKGVTNSLTVSLNRDNISNIVSQSADHLWSHTAPIAIKELLEKKGSRLLGFYKKHGLKINGLLFLTLLTILPGFDLKIRILSVLSFVVFAFIYLTCHRYMSQTIINTKSDEPMTLKEKYPITIYISMLLFSALITASVSFTSNKFFNYLSKYSSYFFQQGSNVTLSKGKVVR